MGRIWREVQEASGEKLAGRVDKWNLAAVLYLNSRPSGCPDESGSLEAITSCAFERHRSLCDGRCHVAGRERASPQFRSL
jgi:hypothetical protein